MKVIEKQGQEHPLNQIYFYLTKGCNLCCRHCWIAPKYQTPDRSYPVLDINLFRSIIAQAKPLGLSGVKLTGGEPLLHPQILEILQIIRSKELTINVETNGTLCTPELAEEIAKGKNSSVSVSLDGADAKTHEWVRGVDGCFEQALEGIKNLVGAGLKPQIIMSIMKHNQDHMESVIHLAESLGAGSVKFNPVQPIARGERLHQGVDNLAIREFIEIGQWVENILSSQTDLHLFYDQPFAFRSLGRIFRKNGYGRNVCGILGILGVLSSGAYALCGIGETTPELVFGHAEKDCLIDVWQETPLLKKLRECLPEKLEGICSNCLMNKICQGYCLAQNYHSSKNLWSPFWYCDEARKGGFFPETRMHSVFG